MPIPGYENAVRVLELEMVFERVRRYTVSEPGARRISDLPFFTARDALSDALLARGVAS